MVVLERLGILPHQAYIPGYNLPLEIEIIILLVVFGLLQVVAFISFYTADLLKKNRDTLHRKNAELNLSYFSIRSLLEQSLVMVKEKGLKHGIEISTSFDGIPETIKADERRVKQIMYNLLSNAMKFTSDGGRVTLSARTSDIGETDIQSASGNSQATVEISVADTGIGLRSEDMELVFKPFEQVENSASRKFPGTGLGLSLTSKLVELRGGRIWAKSPGEGKGATFTFVIPV